MDVTIRRAGVADAEALAALHLDVWEEAYTGLMPQRILDERRAHPFEEHVERRRFWLAGDRSRIWVAVANGELLGFAGSGPGRDEDKAGELELMALYVRAARYGSGLGHALLRTAIGDEPAYLWVLDGNARAIGFYERHGFAFDGVTRTDELGTELRMVRHSTASRKTRPDP